MKNKIILIVIILKIIFVTSVWAQVLTEDEQRLEEFRKAYPSHEETLRALLSLQKAAQEQREQLNNSCEKEKLIMLQNCKTDKPTCDCQNLANQIESLEKNNNSIRNSLETNQQVVKEAETLKQQLEMVNQENQTLRIKVTDLENLKTRVNYLSIQLEERLAKVAELEQQNVVLTENNQKIIEKVSELKRQNASLRSQLKQVLLDNGVEKPLTKPGFDCSKAKTVIEITICNNGELSSADRQLRNIYWKLKRALPKDEAERLRQEQLSWLKRRDTTCSSLSGSDQKNCLLHMYEERISELSSKMP